MVSSSVVKNSTAPTCTAAGEDAYTAYFMVDGQELTAVKLVAVDALNHAWDEVKYTFTDGEKELKTIIGATSCTATRTCEHDGSHVETETVNVIVTGNDATPVSLQVEDFSATKVTW